MTFRLGLTGSIGMGKSTTAQMFRDLGVSVWDADATVHRLYASGGAAVGPIADLVPAAVQNGAVDRTALKAELLRNPSLYDGLETIVHPLVAASRKDFLDQHRADGLVVLDIPLLFETGGQANVDAIAVVTTDAVTQRARVMARPGMTLETMEQILRRQIPDAEKRAGADYIIKTDTLEQTQHDVAALVAKLRQGGNDA